MNSWHTLCSQGIVSGFCFDNMEAINEVYFLFLKISSAHALFMIPKQNLRGWVGWEIG